MKINWKVRIKNKAFWFMLIPALILLIQAVASLFGFTLDLTNVGNKLINVIESVFVVLAIIGVLSVGGIAGYSKAMNKYKINKTTDQVSMLVANIRTIFSSQGNYAGLDSYDTDIRFKVVSEDMIKNGTLRNAFNGNIYFTSNTLNSGDTNGNEAFIIAYSGLPKEACITLATADWGSSQSSGLIAMAIDYVSDEGSLAGDVSDLYTDTPSNTSLPLGTAMPGNKTKPTPMPVAEAVAACSNEEGDALSIVWKYH